MCTQQNDGGVAKLTDTPEQLMAVKARHIGIGNDEVGPLTMKRPDALKAIGSFDHIQLGLKGRAYGQTKLRIVIDDQDTN